MRLSEYLRLGKKPSEIWHLPEAENWKQIVKKSDLEALMAMSDEQLEYEARKYYVVNNFRGLPRTTVIELILAIVNGTDAGKAWFVYELQTHTRKFISEAVKSIDNRCFGFGFLTTALATADKYDIDDFPEIDGKMLRGYRLRVRDDSYKMETIDNTVHARSMAKACLKLKQIPLGRESIKLANFNGVFQYGGKLILLTEDIKDKYTIKWDPSVDTEITLEILDDINQMRNALRPLRIKDLVVNVYEDSYKIIVTNVTDTGPEISLTEILKKFNGDVNDDAIDELIKNWY